MTTDTEARTRTGQTAPPRRTGRPGGQPSGDGAPAHTFTAATLPRRAEWLVVGVTAALLGPLLTFIGVHVAAVVITVVAVSLAAVHGWARAVEGVRKARDRTLSVAITGAFVIALAPLLSLLYTVVQRGFARFDGELVTETMRGVVGEGGGVAHAVTGTLVITLVATAISVPVGILAAIYLAEYGRGRLATALTFFVDVMTGIPSIVAGLFALALFTQLFGPGTRLGVMGSVALAVLMIPIVVRSTEEMLRVVPDSLREASYALGVPKWRTIVRVVLPTSLAGIVTGVTLAVARVIGETAPLLITTGVVASSNWNPLEGRMANLPVFAYNEYSNPGVPNAPYIDRAWAAALLLIVIVMVLSLVARLISRRYGTRTR